VLPTQICKRLAVEAGIAQGWERWVGDQGSVIAMKDFGASAPAKDLFAHFGFTVENIVNKAREMIKL
jgi:transketolase